MNNKPVMVCTNCKYFQRFYVIGIDYSFKPTQLGKCVNSKVSKTISSNRVKKDEEGDLWQPYTLQTISVQYEAEKRLQFYYNKIYDLLVVLHDVE